MGTEGTGLHIGPWPAQSPHTRLFGPYCDSHSFFAHWRSERRERNSATLHPLTPARNTFQRKQHMLMLCPVSERVRTKSVLHYFRNVVGLGLLCLRRRALGWTGVGHLWRPPHPRPAQTNPPKVPVTGPSQSSRSILNSCDKRPTRGSTHRLEQTPWAK